MAARRGRPRNTIGSLLLGVYDNDRLRYAGNVGTGFTEAMLAALLRQLAPLERETSPLGRLDNACPQGCGDLPAVAFEAGAHTARSTPLEKRQIPGGRPVFACPYSLPALLPMT